MCSYKLFAGGNIWNSSLICLEELICLFSLRRVLTSSYPWGDPWHWCPARIIFIIFRLNADLGATLSPCCPLSDPRDAYPGSMLPLRCFFWDALAFLTKRASFLTNVWSSLWSALPGSSLLWLLSFALRESHSKYLALDCYLQYSPLWHSRPIVLHVCLLSLWVGLVVANIPYLDGKMLNPILID